MAKRPGRGGASCKTATSSTPEGELQRHLRALNLESAEAYRLWCRAHGFAAALEKGWQQRRAERAHAERIREQEFARLGMTDHFSVLDVPDQAAYFSWCREHGFAETLNKRPPQKAEEILVRGRERSASALSAARRFDRRPEECIRAIAAGTVDAEALRPPHLRALHDAFAATGADPGFRGALLCLLLHCHRAGRLLSVDPAIAHLGPRPGNTYIGGLLALARHHGEWLRPPESWKPDSHGARRQFGTLARHLLARYDVPIFMDAAWFVEDDGCARRHQSWFLHIGSGYNIRTAGLPMQITKRAAHLFLQAPRDLPIEAAFRWAQAQALGGDLPLARALLATRLAELQEDEPFWQSVIFFLINNPMLDFARIGPVIDYIHNRRFVPAELMGPGGEAVGLAVPEPEFSMKGRTGIALLRRVEEWHRDLARETRRPPMEWKTSGIGAFEWRYRDVAARLDVTWRIDEILSSRGLQEEGKEMRHCAASYAASCARGAASIWTLQVQEGAGAAARRVMTIEVQNARRTVVQARGRCNKSPGEKRSSPRLAYAPDIVRRWAAQQNLTVPGYLFPR